MVVGFSMEQLVAIQIALTPMEFAPRSGRWEQVRKDHLSVNGCCVACGGVLDLNVHHIRPYHLYPHLELDYNNLLTLCNHPARLCHFRVGHCHKWESYNPSVIKDARNQLEMLSGRLFR